MERYYSGESSDILRRGNRVCVRTCGGSVHRGACRANDEGTINGQNKRIKSRDKQIEG